MFSNWEIILIGLPDLVRLKSKIIVYKWPEGQERSLAKGGSLHVMRH